jgi:hypothetical protein
MMEAEMELENARLKTQVILMRKTMTSMQKRHEQQILTLIKAQNHKLNAIEEKEKKNVWGTMKMPISLSEISAIFGIVLLAFSMVGYLLDISPFHLHPDYSKDPCVTGNIQCLRMNPEFNPVPVAVGMLLFVVGVATMDEVEGRGVYSG